MEDVHAAKQTQTRCQLPHRPGHAILNRTHDKVKDQSFQTRSGLGSETLTVRHAGCQTTTPVIQAESGVVAVEHSEWK